VSPLCLNPKTGAPASGKWRYQVRVANSANWRVKILARASRQSYIAGNAATEAPPRCPN